MKNSVRVLLLVGGASYHDQPQHRKLLSEFIGANFSLTMTDNMGILSPKVAPQLSVVK